jgi:hypothetical protein
MTRALLLLTTMLPLLVACAPRPNIIAAGVSGTLTALAPTPILLADRSTSTPVPTLPLANPEPTATPTESASATESTSSEGTDTATIAATEAPSPVPTDTPALDLSAIGELIFDDPFDSPGLWTLGDTENSSVTISGGVMTFIQKTPGTFSFRILGRQGGDFHAEIVGALAKNCGSGDRYGLMFRAQDLSNYYTFQIDCEGRYRFARYVEGAVTAIVDWTPSPAIDRGAQSANTLAVTAKGGAFAFAINGAPVATANDGIFESGRFGVTVGANVTKDFTVVFDNMKVNKVP